MNMLFLKIQKYTLKPALFYMVILFAIAPMAAQNDTIYYDAKWKPSVKDSAAYFRPPVSKVGNLYKVEDYYISGAVQMRATSSSAEKDLWEGKVTWFNENGEAFQVGNYTNNRLDGEFITTFNGKRIVANYKNGYFISGKQNVPSGSIQILTEKKGDSIIEIFYEKNLDGIRYEYYGTKTKSRGLSKYYDQKGKLIGKKEPLPNSYFKGVEVFYNYGPMRVRDINYYPFGNLLISERYYANGQAREKVTEEPNWSKTYFSEDGAQLGKIAYKYENERLRPYQGTEFTFDYGNYREVSPIIVTSRTYEDGKVIEEKSFYPSGKVNTKTAYADGRKELQVSYDEVGNEINKMVYKDYTPFDGTEILKDKKTTYKEGELVEEIKFYPNTDIVQSKKTKTEEVFFAKDGKELGRLQLEYSNRYAKPINGQRFTMDYKNGEVTSIEILKDGYVTNRTSYRKRQVGKDTYKTFRNIEEYDDRSYRTRRMDFYSNGKLQSDVTFKNYKEVSGKYFDEIGNLLGTYDYEKQEGTLYEFFSESDEVKRMEVRENGKTTKLKVYDYGARADYGQINPVLVEDIDANCCASYYTKEGKPIAELTYNDGKPWSGQLYDKNQRTLYTIAEGIRNGTYKKLDYSQRVLEEGTFKNDKEDGVFTYFNYQGVLTKKEKYKNGLLDGTSFFYDASGKELSTMSYVNGKPMNGKRVMSSYRGEIQYEIYRNGTLTEKQSYGTEGKTLTKYNDDKTTESIAYYKDSDKKKLQYQSADTYLNGKVTRYDKQGNPLHTAEFNKGNLESGTVLLNGYEVGSNIHYIKVTRDKDLMYAEFYDMEDNKVFAAEENIAFKGSAVFMKKLYVNTDYLTGSRLY